MCDDDAMRLVTLLSICTVLSACNELAGLGGLHFDSANVGGAGATGGFASGTAGMTNPGGHGGDSGGSGGAGGEGVGGRGGEMPFPTNAVLDDFQSPADGAQNADWAGSTSLYTRVGGRLTTVGGSVATTTYFNARFGPDQEAYATLAMIDTEASEMNIVLKQQGPSTCDLLEVVYRPINARIDVWVCEVGAFAMLASFPVALSNGDRLGARAFASGVVDVYRNAEKVGSVDISQWAFATSAGFIGVSAVRSAAPTEAMLWDDFGGGTVR